ncbi:MAG: uroporphyrinogen-III C-methyltransferase [Treponema sp.]|nr:uroporphyrinogen-III C-methyltransferase [Treponema sp.]
MRTTGKVWLVGAGPGDPDLLTLGGKAALDAADTVIHDRLVPEEILMGLPPGVRLIDVGKFPSRHPVPQEEINRIMREEARKGRRVVRLKGGDPFLFGRGGEELLFLAAEGIPVEVVPGVSSALAVPAAAGIPVTHRGISAGLHIIAWHGKREPSPETLAAIARAGGTLVILMGAAALRRDMTERLTGAGFSPGSPAALIENGAGADQRVSITTLEKLAAAAGAGGPVKAGPPEGEPPDSISSFPPALIVIGPVCSLGKVPVQREARSLRGLRIVVTRPEPKNGELCRNVRALGGRAIPFPCIKTVPSDLIDNRACLEAKNYRWLVYTSAAGVEIFFDRFLRAGGDFRSLGACRFAALGPAAAEALACRGFRPDFVPGLYNGRGLGEGLAEKFAEEIDAPGRVLAIGPEKSAPGLFEALNKGDVPFDKLAVYRTIPSEGGTATRKAIEGGCFDYIFFTSPSAVTAFAEAFPAVTLRGPECLCIGESTARRAGELGMRAHTAAESSAGGLCRLAGELGKKAPGGGDA